MCASFTSTQDAVLLVPPAASGMRSAATPLHWLASSLFVFAVDQRSFVDTLCRHPVEALAALRNEWIKRREDSRKIKWAQHGDAQVRYRLDLKSYEVLSFTFLHQQDPHSKEDKVKRGSVFGQWLVDTFSASLLSSLQEGNVMH